MGRLTVAIVALDMIAILMTAGWIIFSVFRGVSYLELFYNYVYVIIVITALILNMVKMISQEN